MNKIDITLIDFINEYVLIKDNNGNFRKMSETEKREIDFYDNLMKNNFKIKPIHYRKNIKFIKYEK